MFELKESVGVALDVPYVDLALQHRLILPELTDAIHGVLCSGQFVLGDEVLKFERNFAELCNVKYALGVNSGTDALVLILRALGIGPGDEVITAPNSFITSASSIVLVGATPVFVDVSDDYNLDPAKIEEAITEKTKAIMPIHLTGRPCDMTRIMAIAHTYNLKVIEDCAQAVAARIHDKFVGSFGDAGAFSLHPLKTLNACGDGGLITTNDKELYDSLSLLRTNGLRDRSVGVYWSGNSRLDTIQAAILNIKLKYLEQWTLARIKNAAYYRKNLSHIAEISYPTERSDFREVFHTFVIQAEHRDRLRKCMSDHKVGSAIHYDVPIHLQPCAEHLGYKTGDFPVTEHQSKRILSLPIHQDLTVEQLEKVVWVIRQFYKEG